MFHKISMKSRHFTVKEFTLKLNLQYVYLLTNISLKNPLYVEPIAC